MTPNVLKKFEGIKYHQFVLDDVASENILQYLEKVCAILDEDLQTASALVHCNFGVSRSGTAVSAYAMWRLNLKRDEAIELVKKSRRVVHPNDGFLEQLDRFYEECVQPKFAES